MKIGVVKEIKTHEYRVALTPAGVMELRRDGHEVIFQRAPVKAVAFPTRLSGGWAEMRPDAAVVFGEAEMVVKVKEPLEPEWAMMRKDQILFTYLHLAADRKLTEGVLKTGSHCFAYETLEWKGGLPLLDPMSEVAGRLAIQAGAKFLEKPAGGNGILLGGVARGEARQSGGARRRYRGNPRRPHGGWPGRGGDHHGHQPGALTRAR